MLKNGVLGERFDIFRVALMKRHDVVEVYTYLSMFTIFIQTAAQNKDTIPYKYLKLLHVSAYNGFLQDGD